MLIGIALSPENCQALGGKAAFLSLDPLLSETIAQRTQKPIETLPYLAGVNFRLLREIRVDQMPYQANVAFEARPQAKSCEYALRVIRHNSYFETRYELRSQTVDPREKSQAQLIFQDIYANLSPLIGRVKHVELSTVVCHKA
jgi:hypothetical protein